MASARHRTDLKDRTLKVNFSRSQARHSVGKDGQDILDEVVADGVTDIDEVSELLSVDEAAPEAGSSYDAPAPFDLAVPDADEPTPGGLPFLAPAPAPFLSIAAPAEADADVITAEPVAFLPPAEEDVVELAAPETPAFLAADLDMEETETAVEAEPAVEPEPATEAQPVEEPPAPEFTGKSFFGAADSQAPVFFAPAAAPEPVAAPTPVYIQPVYMQPVYAESTEQDAPSYAAPAQHASVAPIAPTSFSLVKDTDEESELGDIDYGPELEIIAPPEKDPFFTWKGKPIGGKPIPANAPPSNIIHVSAPVRPGKAPTKKGHGKVTQGIEAQTWLGETVQRALVAGASDVHLNLNGLKDTMVMRVRIDGQMREFDTLHGEIAQKVMGIFKASAQFASGGSFVPEEAIYAVDVEGEERKARAVLFRQQDGGDALVMRLPPMGDIRKLDELQFSAENLALFKKLLLSANRMLLIAGPMGSGKTTTSHAALMHVATADRSVWTVEDPVERHLPGLTQLEVDDENGAGFEKLLPSLVRADYDTLFLGEIRDKATAGAGVRQAKAGRQVISTIHSNDNVTAVLRLIELAEDTPLSVMDAVKGVVSQRLVRRLNKEWDGQDQNKYKGRVPIHEVMMMNDDLVEAVMEQRPLSEIKQVAAAASASTFAQDAERLITSGVTDAAEIARVLGE